ncbi:MAG: hypothetical protein JSR47_05755 [Proteobacteria bacterium]|nr:hypothetical protein [Pseudomonadota bacterium]
MMFTANIAARGGILLALLVGLTACSNGSLSVLTSVKPPVHADIVTEYNAFTDQYKPFATLYQNAEPGAAQEYVARGYDLADRACILYFAKLKQLRNETTFASDTLSAVFAAGGVIAGLSGAAAPVLVGIFAGSGLVPNTVKNFNSIYLLAEVGDDLYPAITLTMANFRLAHPADRELTPTVNPDNRLDSTLQVGKWTAQQLVQQYASLCSLPSMTAAVVSGVSSLKWDLNPNGTVNVYKAPATPDPKTDKPKPTQ